jgi:hypothetical protein
VKIEHIEHNDPEEAGDDFCASPNLFDLVNRAVNRLRLGHPIDWLPSDIVESRMPDVVPRVVRAEPSTSAMLPAVCLSDQSFLERLQWGLQNCSNEISDITEVGSKPTVTLENAVRPLGLNVPALQCYQRARSQSRGKVTIEECAAVIFYVRGHVSKALNEALAEPYRRDIQHYLLFLRLLLNFFARAPSSTGELYRAAPMDLGHLYREGSTVVWWAVSSCTPKLSLASCISIGRPVWTLFVIRPLRSVLIKPFSDFKDEDEYLLLPGTELFVDKVTRSGSKVEVHLMEVDGQRRVR